MTKFARVFALFIMLSSLVEGLHCWAQSTLHVPSTFRSIQSAIDAAHNGDTILVAPGSYSENLDFKGKSIAVTSGATAYSEAAATIISGANDGPVVVFQTGELSSATLNGFTIQGGHSSSGVRTAGILIDGAAPTITNNIIQNNDFCGVSIFDGASPTLSGNDIRATQYQDPPLEQHHQRCGGPFEAGVSLYSSGTVVLDHNTIESNIFSNATQDGVAFGGAGLIVFGSSRETILKWNTIRNNASLRGNTADAAIYATMQHGTDITLSNNLIYNNVTYGAPQPTTQILFIGSNDALPNPPTLTEVNNTIYGGGQILQLRFGPTTIENNTLINTLTAQDVTAAGLTCYLYPAQGQPIDIRNNDIWNTNSSVDGGCSLGQGNLSTDPLFTSAGSDFRLQKTSPLINAGDTTAPQILPSDLDAKNRTVCNTIDMGAYEHHPQPPIVLTSSANPTPGGGTITFTAHLTGNCNIPTGTVTFLDGGSVIGTGILDTNGTATLSTSFLVVGQHNITVSYPGDFNFDSNNSSILVQVITGDPTQTSLQIAPNSAQALSTITFRAEVSSQYGTPTGTVLFQAAGQTLASAQLDSAGVAIATTTALGAGTYQVTANYTADTRFQASSSTPVQLVVNGINTATTITSSLNPAAVTQNITFTAVVRPTQGNGVPVGTVQFLDGATVLGNVALTNGVAVFTSSSLQAGSHSIGTSYSGASNFSASNASLTEVVNFIGTTLNLSASPNPASTGQTVTLTATADFAAGGVTANGYVTFRDGTTVLGTVPVQGVPDAFNSNRQGIATLTASFSTVGTHPLQAQFTGQGVFGSSTSPIVNEVVELADFALSPAQTNFSVPTGDYTVSTLTVTPLGGFKGSVNLS